MSSFTYTPGRCVCCAELVDPHGFNAAGLDWCPTCWKVYAERGATAVILPRPRLDHMQPRYYVRLFGKWTTRERAWRVLAADYWHMFNRVPLFVPEGWGGPEWCDYIGRTFPRVEYAGNCSVGRFMHYLDDTTREFRALASATVSEVMAVDIP